MFYCRLGWRHRLRVSVCPRVLIELTRQLVALACQCSGSFIRTRRPHYYHGSRAEYYSSTGMCVLRARSLRSLNFKRMNKLQRHANWVPQRSVRARRPKILASGGKYCHSGDWIVVDRLFCHVIFVTRVLVLLAPNRISFGASSFVRWFTVNNVSYKKHGGPHRWQQWQQGGAGILKFVHGRAGTRGK